MIWKGFRFALAIISGKFIFNFGIAERLRTLRYPIFTGGGRDGKRQLQRLFPAEMRRCGGELPKPRFPSGWLRTGGADRGVSSDFCAKSLQKHLKVLFMVSELCDTVFTGKAPEQNRNTGGKHHEGF